MLNDIINILKNELEITIENPTEDTVLSSVGIDSITFMTLIIYIEEKYNIEFAFDGIFMQDYSQITFKVLINEIKQLLADK